ncbi:polyprenyl synthetase family protein [Paenibacillus kobensis]|uniref:polyprenyl synthetase family protein n=1 Tax=Paenibacillus kobensis TaxID=59841 RepID=UPI000FD94B34|nr:polyprenyl synthetase family protein [Paenibacillus kobensis]
MSTMLQPAVDLMRSSISRAFHEAELRSLAEQFVEYKQTEGSSFGQLAALHCAMFGGDEQRATAAAAAIDLMILSLDIYDDLQDQDNDSVPWSKVPPALALNVAIGLQALSIDVLMKLPSPIDRKAAAVQALNQGILGAVNGQHVDILNHLLTEEESLQMIADKAGSLIAASCLVGIALVTDEHHDIVEQYGRAIGVSAQLYNDVKGITSWSTRNDLLARKLTLPVQFLLEQQSEEAAIVRKYYDGEITAAQLLEHKIAIMDYIHGCGCVEYGLVLGKMKQYEAEESIALLPVEETWREQLRSFV